MRELLYGRYCGPFWTIVFIVTVIYFPAGFTLAGVAIALWIAWEIFKAVSHGVARFIHTVVYSVSDGWGSARPTRVVIHAIPDTRAQDQKEVERRYQKNVELIQNSRLSAAAKQQLLDDELKLYQERLKQLLQ